MGAAAPPGLTSLPLTARELLVARAAAGKSSRQIAAELYIGIKTVEFHLRQTLAGLDLDSRTQIARTLTTPRLPALPPQSPRGLPVACQYC